MTDDEIFAKFIYDEIARNGNSRKNPDLIDTVENFDVLLEVLAYPEVAKEKYVKLAKKYRKIILDELNELNKDYK